MDLINIKDLIAELKKRNIDLGKGNPYNRLRYYTKIGWIDHMIRKKDNLGVVTGHYPATVIEKIEEIENLKRSGLSNEEISIFLKKPKSKIETEFNIFDEIKKKININIVILTIIIIGFIFELNNYNSLNEKLPIINTKDQVITQDIKIDDRGSNTLPSGKNKIFINSKKVSQKSIILITFEGKIEPASYYYIYEKINGEGFTLETNFSVNKDVNFNWIIIN